MSNRYYALICFCFIVTVILVVEFFVSTCGPLRYESAGVRGGPTHWVLVGVVVLREWRCRGCDDVWCVVFQQMDVFAIGRPMWMPN